MTNAIRKENGLKGLKSCLIGILVAMVLFSGAGCSVPSEDQKSVIQPSNDAVTYDFSNDISDDNLLATLNTLASKDNARVTGFEGEREAADYISEQFKALGLEVSEQPFPVKAYLCENVAVNVVSDENRSLEGIRVLNFSGATPKEGLTSALVSVGMGTDADFNDKDVKGKIVLVQRGGEYYRIKVARAAELGAVGAVFYDPNTEGAIAATLGAPSLIPGVSLTRADGETLENSLKAGEAVTLKLTVDSSVADSESQNVLGLLKSNLILMGSV